MTTPWALLHVAAQRDYDLHSLDFSMALLQGSLHERIWLLRPPGFTGSFPLGTQWQLRRLVYGLRQAPREWHNTLRTALTALGFFLLSADSSLFICRTSTLLFVLIYVDNLVFATPDRTALASVKEEQQRRHSSTDLGELQRYLGLQITRAAHTITLMQSHMVEQILTQFCFPFSKVQLTPRGVNHGLTAPPSDESFGSSAPLCCAWETQAFSLVGWLEGGEYIRHGTCPWREAASYTHKFLGLVVRRLWSDVQVFTGLLLQP
ncbi:unnamed protein product [Closterium sp. NIES-53]